MKRNKLFFAPALLASTFSKTLTTSAKSAQRHLPPRGKLVGLLFLIILASNLSSAAHWIAGYVEDASDSTSPNGRTVRLWNPITTEEAFTIVGPSGQAGTSNVYMIDCEMLATPCIVGDKLNLTLTDDLSGYLPKNIVQITVTGAGFDMAPNLTMTVPFIFTNLTIEDFLTSPSNEIDLTPATTSLVNCFGVVEGDKGTINFSSVQAEIFSTSSSFGSLDDNNNHYTNSTCDINTSYGNINQAMINCTFNVEYYAESGTWNCQINATDNFSSSAIMSDATNINTLLAIGVDSIIQFGEINAKEVSQEQIANVTNYGNVQINLTLSGHGQTPMDGNAMECGTNDIIIDYMKYNLTASNSSDITLAEFETLYQNLTSSPVTNEFNLNFRQNDETNEAVKDTYWRVYVPQGVNQGCAGNIVFGATQS